jgi:3'-phosphoadenosine 5'-phosphosulfate sulfotransferase (PAPS reductase)/FAD synthetase
MHDPFKIDGPTCLSFSGGRTSAYMLWRVLQSNDGLPPEAVVCFANTGKEDEKSLIFVRDCAEEWGVRILWLEYRDGDPRFAVVSFNTASREGEPFAALIRKRNYLPNPVARFCTTELKVLTIERYLKAQGWMEWDSMIGVRADEPRRVAKMRIDPSGGRSGVTRLVPLADAGIRAADVGAFWRAHCFDLGLPNNGGTTMHGNCDLCFLKPAAQVLSLITENPGRAIWWASMEGSITNPGITNGGTFRNDRPSYAQMARFANEQRDLFDPNEEAIVCFCGD